VTIMVIVIWNCVLPTAPTRLAFRMNESDHHPVRYYLPDAETLLVVMSPSTSPIGHFENHPALESTSVEYDNFSARKFNKERSKPCSTSR